MLSKCDGRERASGAYRRGIEVREAPRRPTPIVTVILLGAIGAVAAAAIIWSACGGALYDIATPSMCPHLCVGTLVFDRPLERPVAPGMVVTFAPPGTTTLYTHRVVRVLADGWFKTAGDALGTIDPWTVPPGRVVGRVVAHLSGVGWLWRYLPALALTGTLWVFARGAIRATLRCQYDLLAIALVVVVFVWATRPLVGAELISSQVGRRGTVAIEVVNTAMFAARFKLSGSPRLLRVGPGQLATLRTHLEHAVWLHDAAALSSWQWIVLILVIASPLLAGVAPLLHQRLGVHGGRTKRGPPVLPLTR